VNKFAPYFKAIVAALIAGASAAIPQIDDGLSASEALGVARAFLTALSVVFAVPNKDPEGTKQDESVQPPEDTQNILGKA